MKYLCLSRDTGATLSLLVQGVIDLPAASCLNAPSPIGVFGGGFCLYLCTSFSEIKCVWTCHSRARPSIPIKRVTFVLGTDLAGTQVFVTPILCKEPCEVPETKTLVREHPEVFSACVVTRAVS